MPMTNYPSGFADGISIRGVPIAQTHPGQVFWVGNNTTLTPGTVGGADGNPGTYQRPFATLEYALSKCKANTGDVIFIKPGHAESIASATALNFDVAGVAIIGLGIGSNRPTFTFTTANTATIPVTAANMSIQNCLFVANFLSVASAFTVAAAPEFTIENCEFRDTSAILDFLTAVTTTVTVNADGLYYARNKRVSIGTTTPGADLVIAGTMSRLKVLYNNTFHLVATNNVAALVEHGALVMSHAEIIGNYVYSVNTDTATGAILVKTTATTGSGIIAHNRIRALDVAAEIVVTAAAVQYGMFDNLYIGETTLASGFVSPAIGSTA